MVRRYGANQKQMGGVLMFNDVVTIINHYYDAIAREDRFNKTVLKNCMWRKKTVKTVANNQIQVDDAVSLTILYQSGYIEPNIYSKLPNDEKKSFFTLNAENNMDLIVLGEVKENILDYSSIQELKKNYQYVTIAGVSDNTLVDGLKNWKVTAK